MSRAKVQDHEVEVASGDRFPQDEEAHDALISWAQKAFAAADAARQHHVTNWERYYKLYRSYVAKTVGDWRSKMFIPICFWIVETIAPRLVAQLPKFLCSPLNEEDVVPARAMEKLLDHAVNNGTPDTYVEFVKQMKSGLIFGTGIIKTRYVTDYVVGHEVVPDIQEIKEPQDIPIIDPQTGLPATDINGEVMTERQEISLGFAQVGTKSKRKRHVAYDGPICEYVDLMNFWVAPEASDIETARYVIHRSYQPLHYIQRRINEGIYQILDGLEISEGDHADTEEVLALRLGLIERGGQVTDETLKNVKIDEYWTREGTVLTIANDKVVLRYMDNPFDHGEKPFHRIVDHLVPNEFYGIGEIEYLEGLQTLQNALVNQRIDNVRLSNNQVFVVNTNMLVDREQLAFRPGAVIETNGNALPGEILMPLSIPDVTAGAMAEAQENMRVIEQSSGVSSYQQGVDTPGQQDTATGVTAMMQAGDTRFGMKVRMAELMCYQNIARQYGSMIQQFANEAKTIKILGPDGWVFETFDPADIQGALSYEIEAGSQIQTEAAQREQATANLQIASSYIRPNPMTGEPGPGVDALLEDFFRSQGKKDIARYIAQNPMMAPIVAAAIDPMSGMPMDEIGAPGGRQEFGEAMPPGALGVGQSAQFGPRGTPPEAAMFRDLTQRNTEGGVAGIL